MTSKPALPKRSRSAADWEVIERDYRAGVKSVRQIAKEQGVSHTAIQKRADAESWTRDLGAKIRAAAEAKLAREVAKAQVATTEVAKAAERDIVEANATLQAQIVREHRADIQRARGLAQRLMADLEQAVQHRLVLEEAIEELTADDRSLQRRNALMKAVSIAEHTGTLEAMSRTLKNLIALERQAFGIDQMDDQNPDDSYESRLVRLRTIAETPEAEPSDGSAAA